MAMRNIMTDEQYINELMEEVSLNSVDDDCMSDVVVASVAAEFEELLCTGEMDGLFYSMEE